MRASTMVGKRTSDRNREVLAVLPLRLGIRIAALLGGGAAAYAAGFRDMGRCVPRGGDGVDSVAEATRAMHD